MTQSKRHICIFSGKRGGFNHLAAIIERVKETQAADVSLIVADMHLSTQFGNTVDEVEQHGVTVHKLHTMLASDSRNARAKSIGLGLIGAADLLERLAPDFLVVLGDRGEILSVAIAAMQLNIPIAHIFGGDLTQGGVDEVVRHAMTKMANIHFPATEESAERIRRMGEEDWRVHCVGSPALDFIRRERFAPADAVGERFGLDMDKPFLLLLQHSVTWQVDEAARQIEQTLYAVNKSGMPCVAVYPCSDPGYEPIITALEGAVSETFQVHRNIEMEYFWGLMNEAAALVGNSSAGILEAPSFGLPCVNIGIRQEGRLQGSNVIDVPNEAGPILAAINQATDDSEFQAICARKESPYGDGRASDRIVDVLTSVPLDDKLLRKRMTY